MRSRTGIIVFVAVLWGIGIFLAGCATGLSNGNSNPTAPLITTQPASQSVTVGQTATFNVAATGTMPLNYQWTKNGANVGTNSSSYTTAPTTMTDNGATIQVKVTNAAGNALSATATLTVNAGPVAPTITQQPASRTVTVGQTAAFNVVAMGTAPLNYQWTKNGANVGTNSASYTTAPTTMADNGATIQVKVSNSVGNALSAIATLTVNPATAGNANVLTYHNDNGRTGQNPNETILTPANVNSTSFGRVGFLPVQGLVDAEPLYVSNLTVAGGPHNVVFIVTEHDLVYAFDADTFAQLWRVSVLGVNESPSDDRGCSQVTPEIGITSTPVIDLNAGVHGTMYLVAMSKNNSGSYFQRLHALDLTTGAEENGSPVVIQASFPNSGGQVTFAPGQYKERASLLLMNGLIHTAWASHCDFQPYTGWIMSYSQATLQQVSVLNITPNGSEGAIWMSGAGLAGDASGNVYFLAGNGIFDTTLDANGFPVSGDYGNGFLKLSTSGNHLAVADYFMMHDSVSESGGDTDLGSGGALVLPDLKDTSGTTRHLAVGAGKDARIYVVNRDSMGKFNPANDNAIYQEITSNGLGGAVFAMPAYFNNTLYYGAVNDSLKAFPIVNARVVAPPASKSAASFSYPGSTPSVSANGTSNGIVWAVEDAGTGVLHAFDATDLTKELYNSNQAGTRDQFADNKFITPMIANGKVFIGTPTGVIVLGLLP